METKAFTMMADLTALYGPLLTPKQRQIMQSRYHQDYSLAEISEQMNISRSAVHDTIKKASEKLGNIEAKLHFLKHHQRREEFIHKLEDTPLNEDQLKLIEKLKEVI